MSHQLNSKDKEFRFSPKIIFRLFIFFLLFYFLVNYLSFHQQNNNLSTKPDPTVLGEEDKINPLENIYQSLPVNTRQYIENIGSNPAIIDLQKDVENIKLKTDGFPQKQIKNIKKAIVKNLSEEILRSIDEE